MNQADSDVRNDLKWTCLAEMAIVLVGHARGAAEAADISGFTALFVPNRKVPNAQ